jgi:hypothetical protein
MMSEFSESVEQSLDEKYGAGKWHCDDIWTEGRVPQIVLDFLDVARSPAHGFGKECKTLYATLDGKPCRVNLASRFGDVGVSFDLKKPYGYDKRVFIPELSNFTETPPQHGGENDR